MGRAVECSTVCINAEPESSKTNDTCHCTTKGGLSSVRNLNQETHRKLAEAFQPAQTDALLLD